MRTVTRNFVLGSAAALSLSLAACDIDPDAVVDESADEAVAANASAINIPQPIWANAPLFLPQLEIHVCDVADGGTDDNMVARFQIGSSLSTFKLDRPGDDFERNGTYTYSFPAFGSKIAQMRDLNHFEIEKSGDDGVCIDRVAIRAHGIKLWEYSTSDNYGGTYLMPSVSGQRDGRIWLDGDDGPSQRVRFTDKSIHFGDRTRMGEIKVELHTCDTSSAETDDDVRLRWTHDGIVEPPVKLDKRGDDFARNKWGSYVISPYEAVEKIDSLRLEKTGENGVCIDRVKVYANGHLVTDKTIHIFLDDADGEGWTGKELLKDVQVQTGASVGFLGLPYAGADFVDGVNASYASTPNGNHPSCDPPAKLSADNLEGIIATIVAAKLTGKKFWGSSGHVNVEKAAGESRAVHANVRFEADAPGLGNAVFWLKFNVNVSCGDPTPNLPNDGPTHQLMLTISNFSTDYDAPALSDVLNWFSGAFGGPTIESKLKNALAVDPIVFDTGNACPGISVSSAGDILLAWPALPLPNAICRKNL